MRKTRRKFHDSFVTTDFYLWNSASAELTTIKRTYLLLQRKHIHLFTRDDAAVLLKLLWLQNSIIRLCTSTCSEQSMIRSYKTETKFGFSSKISMHAHESVFKQGTPPWTRVFVHLITENPAEEPWLKPKVMHTLTVGSLQQVFLLAPVMQHLETAEIQHLTWKIKGFQVRLISLIYLPKAPLVLPHHLLSTATWISSHDWKLEG